MEVMYETNMYEKQLVIKEPCSEVKESFRIAMIRENQLDGILPVKIQYEDGCRLYYYTVTDCSLLRDQLEGRSLEYMEIHEIVNQILTSIHTSFQYMLNETDFILALEYLYVNSKNQVQLCYYEGYGKPISSQLKELAQFFMNRVNYESEDAVRYVYRFYQVVNNLNLNLSSIINSLAQMEKQVNKTYEESYNNKKDSSCNEYSDLQQKSSCTEQAYDSVVPSKTKKYDTVEKKGNRETQIEGKNIYATYDSHKKKDNKVNEKVDRKVEHKPIQHLDVAVVITGITVLCILFLFYVVGKTGIIMTEEHTIDHTKLSAFVVVVGIVEGYVLWKVFDKYPLKKKEDAQSIEIKSEERNNYYEGIQNETMNCSYENQKGSYYEDNHTTILSIEETNTNLCYQLVPREVDTIAPIRIRQSSVTIGKLKEEADVIIPLNTISRKHAQVEIVDGELYIRDLQSTNGTFVNYVRLDQVVRKKVKEGDIIHFANIGFEVIQETA